MLEIILKNLDYNKELGKYFKGTKFIEGANQEGGRNARENRMIKHMKNNRNIKNFKKYKLVHCDTTHMKNPERFICKQIGQNSYYQL